MNSRPSMATSSQRRCRNLWRGSISKSRSFRLIDLGPYKSVARDVLFGAKPLAAFRQFEVLMARYVIAAHGRLYRNPVRNKRPLHHYAFSLCEFNVVAKIDSRPFPPKTRSYIVNGNDTLRGIFMDFSDTPEAKAVAEHLRAHERRGDRKIV